MRVLYTERARRILGMAMREAAERQDVVRPEHLLLCMVREGSDVGATVLGRLGLDRADVESALDRSLPRNAAPPSEIPVQQHRHEVEAAAEEARELGHGYVGTEHLLLGLIRSATEEMATMFAQAGITLDRARAAVLALLHERR